MDITEEFLCHRTTFGGIPLAWSGAVQVRTLSLFFICAFAATSAAAADKPVPNSLLPPGIRSITVTLTKDERAAVRELDRKRKMPRKQFERNLLSAPIGEGRLE